MSLNVLVGSGRRRAVDKVAELREENTLLLNRLAAADDFFAALMADRADMYTAWRTAQSNAECAEGLALKLTVERDQLAVEVRALHAWLAPYLAAEANRAAFTVPPMVRDTTDGADQATAPIDVRPLWDALGVGPVVDATSPGHVPSWAETEELPVVDIPQKEVA